MKVSMFSDESGMFQRMTPMPFKPDLLPPPSDTIKDILEERDESYDDFVFQVAQDTGWKDSPKIIYDIFDGEEEMCLYVADYLSAHLGSTSEFWLDRSSDYREQQTPRVAVIDDGKYTDLILIDFLLQMDKGIAAKDCKVRFTKQEIEEYLSVE